MNAPRMEQPDLLSELEEICPGGVLRDVPLATISRWKIGGSANLVIRPRSTEALARLRSFFHDRRQAHLVIGATSNLLFADEGLRVPCIQIGRDFSSVSVEATRIVAEAGVWVPGLALLAMRHGLAGIVHTCGVPGTIGGLVCMNGGTQRKGIGDHLDTVVSVAEDGTILSRVRAECGFAYRRSIFQDNSEIIAGVTLGLEPGADRGALRREMLEILASRRGKFPQKLPNCGSVFVSNPAMYADYGPPGAVIEKLGFKGRRIGDALVSPVHANFIVNAGAATARDTLALIAEIREAAHRETGYLMEVEARFVTSDGRILPADGGAEMAGRDTVQGMRT